MPSSGSILCGAIATGGITAGLLDLLLRPYRRAPRFAYNLIAWHPGTNCVDR